MLKILPEDEKTRIELFDLLGVQGGTYHQLRDHITVFPMPLTNANTRVFQLKNSKIVGFASGDKFWIDIGHCVVCYKTGTSIEIILSQKLQNWFIDYIYNN